MKTRKLISCYDSPTQKGFRFISFAYYDKNNRYNGESEEALISEENFYTCLKPLLKYTKERR